MVLQFGEIDIDSSLVSSKEFVPDSGQIMMLNNGCMCCTVKDDLVNMLTDLASIFSSNVYFLYAHMAQMCFVFVVNMQCSSDCLSINSCCTPPNLASTFAPKLISNVPCHTQPMPLLYFVFTVL